MHLHVVIGVAYEFAQRSWTRRARRGVVKCSYRTGREEDFEPGSVQQVLEVKVRGWWERSCLGGMAEAWRGWVPRWAAVCLTVWPRSDAVGRGAHVRRCTRV